MEGIENLLGVYDSELTWYQMSLRAIFMFITALILIRISGMRTFGNQSAFDVVISLMMGGILSRGVTGHYPFLPVLCGAAALAFSHRIVALLSRKYDCIGKLTVGSPVLLFDQGVYLEKNLIKHTITKNDLQAALHENNLDDYDQVKSMWLEPTGKISVVKK